MFRMSLIVLSCFVLLVGCDNSSDTAQAPPAASTETSVQTVPAEVTEIVTEVVSSGDEAVETATEIVESTGDAVDLKTESTNPAGAVEPGKVIEPDGEAIEPLESSEMMSLKSAPSASAEADDLQGRLAHHNFVLETVDGKIFTYPRPEGVTIVMPNLSFGQWPHASGKICNNYRGDVELEGDVLFIRKAASTLMICPFNELNELETLFHKMIAAGVKVELDEQKLTLTGSDHVLVFRLLDFVS